MAGKMRLRHAVALFFGMTVGIWHTFWWQIFVLPFLAVRLYSVKLYRRIENKLYELVSLSLTMFCEKYANVQVRFFGDRLPRKNENALIVSNHLGTSDGLLFHMMAARRRAQGRLRFVAKEGVKYLFPAGTLMWMHDCVFIKRKFEQDETNILRQLQSFKSNDSPLWLVFFPEGTYISPKRLDLLHRGQEFARKNGLPVLQNLMTPRTKGLELILGDRCSLPKHIDAIYDVTMAFNGPYDVRLGEKEPPSLPRHLAQMMNVDYEKGANEKKTDSKLKRESVKVNFHIRRIPVSELPKEADIPRWVNGLFFEKEKLLEYFHQHRRFPGPALAERLPETYWLPNLFLSYLIPALTCGFWCRLFIRLMGSFRAAMPFFITGLVLFFTVVLAVLFYLVAQGNKKRLASSGSAVPSSSSSASSKSHGPLSSDNNGGIPSDAAAALAEVEAMTEAESADDPIPIEEELRQRINKSQGAAETD